jgi:hypothetical protein
LNCPVCGQANGTCHGAEPVILTTEQAADIGLKPEQLTGGTITVNQKEPQIRYPKQEVADGQEHGYIGDVEVYDPPQQEAGFSNAEPPAQPKTTRTSQTAADAAPAEQPVVGDAGALVADAQDNVQPKSTARKR